MSNTRIKIASIVENQLPYYVKDEFPLVGEFLNQYYESVENQGNAYDILQNIDQYIKVDQLSSIIDSTNLTSSVDVFDTTINVESTFGFPEKYGLLLINDEVVTYTSKTNTQFLNCIRGFSATTSFTGSTEDELVFSETNAGLHEFTPTNKVVVQNLSILFLKEFFKKVKKQIAPGFENRELYSEVNQNLFVKQSKDFYSSKGTDESFKILFSALFGKNVEVIKPRDYLFEPSDAQYRVTRNLIVESLLGDPNQLVNRTLYQDPSNFFDLARGTVTNVEKIFRGSKEYYILSLDYDYDKDISVRGSVFGEFEILPKTLITSKVSPGSSFIDVDSTLGFPESGNLIYINEDNDQINISYTSKTINQFLGCGGVSETIPSKSIVRYDYYAYGLDSNDNEIRVAITGCLSGVQFLQQTSLLSVGDKIEVKTLGNNIEGEKFNNWILNIATKYDVSNIISVDPSNSRYRISTKNEHIFFSGDKCVLISNDGTETSGVVSLVEDKNNIIVGLNNNIDLNSTYYIHRSISKSSSIFYPDSNQYSTDVQNIYFDLNQENKNTAYVASNSIPSYLNEPLYASDRSINFTGNFNGEDLVIGNHPFFTGDAVYYFEMQIGEQIDYNYPEGIYYVKKVNSNTIKLATSRENILKNKFISLSGRKDNFRLVEVKSVKNDGTRKTLLPQKLIRKISPPLKSSIKTETNSGGIGIFNNGVEILNYKSDDYIYYGPIQEIIPTSLGTNYDIINPPNLEVFDSVGSGVSCYLSLEGSLSKIDIINGGFDYLTEPTVLLSGGGGTGAKVQVNMTSFDHIVEFDSEKSVNLDDNIISFNNPHFFRLNEKVIYDNQIQDPIGGLSNTEHYYVSVIDENRIKLYSTLNDSIVGVNTINFTSYGKGLHLIKSLTKKRKISSLKVVDPGFGYKNRKTSVSSVGINTYSNIIEIKNHGYSSGEIITYSNENGSLISGISSTSYYVTVIDEDKFKLSRIGSDNQRDFFYKTKQYIDLKSTGSGTHIFNYEPITLQLFGITGVSTFSASESLAQLRPIFRGNINSVFITEFGQNYGNSEIINLNRQPEFRITGTGSGCELQPIINQGRITDVLVLNPGNDYISTPDIVIEGDGIGAVLSPNIVDGRITSINVIYGGLEYTYEKTSIFVSSAGNSAEFEARIRPWRINLFDRYLTSNTIFQDDGIISQPLDDLNDLQYYHLYAPRKLRQILLSSKFRDGVQVFTPDLRTLQGKEIVSDSHSPIIGWAYDGNPIYGPYGYENKTGGGIKSLTSGYIKTFKPGRPSTSLYPLGFFVEDFEYVGNSDLDESNGRYCVTPEFPNGTYAYFCTINDGAAESSGPFNNFKIPVFPYVIGNVYNSKPIDFNFDKKSNQDSIDLNAQSFIRNTTAYNIFDGNNGYDYFTNLDNVNNINSLISAVKDGIVGDIIIENRGDDYKVNDRIIFDSEKTEGSGALASIISIEGRNIDQISCESIEFENIEFIPSGENNVFIGILSSPHSFTDKEILTFSADNERFSEVKITIDQSNELILSKDLPNIDQTGICTYIYVLSNFNPNNIFENDIYQISGEKIKILNIDTNTSTIRVLRGLPGSVGISSYSAGLAITESPRSIKTNLNLLGNYNFVRNRELYFDPNESLGIGTIGFTTTTIISNGSNEVVKIPAQVLKFNLHNVKTGYSLIYSSNGGSPISISTDGITYSNLSENDVLYAVNLDSNSIGLCTTRNDSFTSVGLGTTSSKLLYFGSVGTGNTHSFKTDIGSLFGKLERNKVTVSVSTDHNLSVNDLVEIDIKPGITTTYVVKYDDKNRRFILNQREFVSGDVNLFNNSIRIINHGYQNGDKIIYNSTSVVGGLEDNAFYYVVVDDEDNILLSSSYFETTKISPTIVELTSVGDGTISPINPRINTIANYTIIFDLSDSSLAYTKNFSRYSAFDFNFYIDEKLNSNLESSDLDFSLNSDFIERIGQIGIDNNASVSIRLSDNLPKSLYYGLKAIDLENNLAVKKEYVVDDEIPSHNRILVEPSKYNGTYSIIGVTTTSFEFITNDRPEVLSYTSSGIGTFNYYTTSKTALGPIHKVLLESGGSFYKSQPTITSIASSTGFDGVLSVKNEGIGEFSQVQNRDIGFDYSVDKTIRPFAKPPTLLKVKPLSSFGEVRVISPGVNYNTTPNLIALDGITNTIISDVDLRFDMENVKVDIIKNSKGINAATPIVLPVSNSNGVKINDITYNIGTKDVVVSLGASFSDIRDFPFEIGDDVFIENVSIVNNGTIVSTGTGYNSDQYNYSFFKITDIQPNIGGAGANVTYNMSSVLGSSGFPGIYDTVISTGRIIPKKHFPIFEVILNRNSFNFGEKVYLQNNTNLIGNVISWDGYNEFLKIQTKFDFISGDSIFGESSKSEGIVTEVISTEASFEVGGSSIVSSGWKKETGFFNNALQRIHDSDYYQYFSYSLKSEVPFDEWNEQVSSLNHTSGFKKFGDLIINSESQGIGNFDPENTFVGITTTQDNGDISAIVDFDSIIDLNCYYDYDLVSENSINLDNYRVSNRVIFNTKILEDYLESVGNKVLTIDDISGEFNSDPRPTSYDVIDTFNIVEKRYTKYFTICRDRRFTGEIQSLIVSMLHDSNEAYLNQYGRVETFTDIGTFDAEIFDGDLELRFYPVLDQRNDYNLTFVSYNITDLTTGIGSTSIGDVLSIASTSTQVSTGTSTPFQIASLDVNTLGSKVLVQIGSTDQSYFEVNEISIISNGSDVSLVDYGQLTAGELYVGGSYGGIGTYNAYIDGSILKLEIVPDFEIPKDLIINSLGIHMPSGVSTGIGTESYKRIDKIDLNNSELSSYYAFYGAIDSTSQNIISKYDRDYNCAYYIVLVEDLTNNKNQLSEILVINDQDNAYITEYAVLNTEFDDYRIGTFQVNLTSTDVELLFASNDPVQIRIKIFQNPLKVNDTIQNYSDVDFTNSIISSNIGSYIGRFNDIRTAFDLKHDGETILERYFDGSDPNIVSISDNKIRLPENNFVTGEEVYYDFVNSDGLSSPIGIVTTTISGIGVTDTLPSRFYIVKSDSLFVRVAASASEALASVPSLLTLRNVGIGTSHRFYSKNNNTKSLISVDNIIQTPIKKTNTSTTLVSDVKTIDSRIEFAGITSFFAGDFIQINDEIMKIVNVGIGSANVMLVDRSLLGTGIASHFSGNVVYKIDGNYNIVENKIHFASAPYGPTPIGTTTNSPDEIDFVGIETRSSFNGRLFFRSAIPNTTNEAYYDNYLFDDISSNFTGFTTEFNLQSNNSNITGISSNNAIVLINNIFQLPSRLGGIEVVGNYNLIENPSSTQISFQGNTISNNYDVNTASVPRGGVLVSVGSTKGFGYQPLISAGGTAIVSDSGSITNISIGNSGSGYRSEIQSNIQIGIITESLETYDKFIVGVATINQGSVVGVSVTNPGIGFTNYSTDFTRNISSPISIGSTEIFINDISSITTDHYIFVENEFSNVRIVGVGSTSIFVGISDTSSSSISTGTTALIKRYTPPIVVFDAPLSYTDIPLIYSNSSSGVGTGARVDLIVSQDTSVLSFEIKNSGYGYKTGDILTIEAGPLAGIQTTGSSFSEFQIIVDKTFDDDFSGWTMGQLQIIDSIENLFNGLRRTFPIKINGNQTSLRPKPGLNLDIESALIVFINDILQVPRDGYVFPGGSNITFIEPPKEGDTCKIMFYSGTRDIDVVFVDILESIKVGDYVTIESDDSTLKQDERLVTNIISSDELETNPYNGKGITNDETLLRPVKWCKQTEDIVIDGIPVNKDRILYEPLIYPTSNIIKNVSSTDSEIFVDNIRTFFDNSNEYSINDLGGKRQNKVVLISQDTLSVATASCVVSTAGTISSIVVDDAGNGYTQIPSVTISNPVGLGTTQRATAVASISGGQVTSIDIINPGLSYDQSNPPQILIELPNQKREILEDVVYEGDFGYIVGVSTFSSGITTNGLVFDFYIPTDSFLRNPVIYDVGIGSTGISGIKTDYYFVVSNSNIGDGVVSLGNSGNIISVGSSCLDNIYQAISVSVAQTAVPGIGTTSVLKVLSNVSDYSGISGLGFSNFYGMYSWGRLSNLTRLSGNEFKNYGGTLSGINTSDIVQRFNSLKYFDYNT